MSDQKKISEPVTGVELEVIEELAEGNFAPSQIALSLRRDKRSFMHLWRDPKSAVRLAYERGRLEIEKTKVNQLITKIEGGSETAIQIHDKHTELQRFEDIKKTIFSFE
ncbi:hypothetical protein M1M27_gp48 [Cellulophaga phage Ingeline_1]|uniref:Uncharacterized protein n=1 Tax=Cellulophaga phage Ingeline_1 TaxID=2745674 RepID=A0A8E4ZBV8_9CAUD|nr:hypothetical protein M1M27_gp48 [Cellulophaga phage Ingeline_1]QQV90017.1 hypothetical protein Ingeline2_3 [Cellulophaga phage Ingeline_2]QQV90067.1 hypothetical protein Ingeline3_3 [Cellulophaga phage Ingeline_3]QQV90117.1 hypothetical protein Ingeline4_3 [Cellulophaga phage Ingeline_4]QQV90167.1 hypothetical protein Ingeline5_3 [Cellulophaga phage Ingeline_5]QQV90216.1 hypothetical protein Ingeline6_3 [Cellulophaga phage Ingeline_6]QQV90266.1 hypothetical protein Ingeline7_3 [Cellulophag